MSQFTPLRDCGGSTDRRGSAQWRSPRAPVRRQRDRLNETTDRDGRVSRIGGVPRGHSGRRVAGVIRPVGVGGAAGPSCGRRCQDVFRSLHPPTRPGRDPTSVGVGDFDEDGRRGPCRRSARRGRGERRRNRADGLGGRRARSISGARSAHSGRRGRSRRSSANSPATRISMCSPCRGTAPGSRCWSVTAPVASPDAISRSASAASPGRARWRTSTGPTRRRGGRRPTRGLRPRRGVRVERTRPAR